MFKRGDNISKVLDNPKELILKVAKELAYEEGINKINMRKLATRCNIALGTIYNYYPNKIDIVIDVVEDFWNECFENIDFMLDEKLDFFQQLKKLYFYMLNYLEKFESNWLKDLANLSSLNKKKGRARELKYILRFHEISIELLETHKAEFNKDIFNRFTQDEVIKFIIQNIFLMLRTYQRDYSFFDYTLKKVLL
ncbi:TetR/AcrR family transcriptional regulator [Clostridium sp.]|uniref:TetR/AcrR family transcriptional regulator n=1 Tax=Clostridium sp. TaxID=1506 RepID=UPI003F3F2AF0